MENSTIRKALKEHLEEIVHVLADDDLSAKRHPQRAEATP